MLFHFNINHLSFERQSFNYFLLFNHCYLIIISIITVLRNVKRANDFDRKKKEEERKRKVNKKRKERDEDLVIRKP